MVNTENVQRSQIVNRKINIEYEVGLRETSIWVVPVVPEL